jgi:hypothetical protein
MTVPVAVPDRQLEHPQLHRGHAGKSPESRARSLAGLRRGNVVHGATTKAIMRPIEARERRRLRRMFPDASSTPLGAETVRTCAARQALIGRWLGQVQDGNAGRKTDAAAANAARLLVAQERGLAKLAALDRQTGTVTPNALESIRREYAARGNARVNEQGETDHER